ncbi:hypothetical protein ES703_108421 [subsurface metagenome]
MQIELTFARAWDLILNDHHLEPPEKLVLIEVCRFRPKLYNGTNATIASRTGFSIRHIQRILHALAVGPKGRKAQGLPHRRKYLNLDYGHYRVNGKLYTVRLISQLFMTGKSEPPDVLTSKKGRSA